LAEALCEYTGLDGYVAISRLFYSAADTNVKIAAFAPRVVELTERGCGPAQQVIAESLVEFAVLVNRVLVKIFPAAARAQSGFACATQFVTLPSCLETR
jgi:N-acetylglucosamine kinase-like BadF-type ATPase